MSDIRSTSAATPASDALQQGGQFHADLTSEAQRLRALCLRDPRSAETHRRLGAVLRKLGEDEAASAAEIAAVKAAAHDPAMIAIATSMMANDLQQAEALLRARLKQQPLDVAAIRLMAELAARIGRLKDSEALLRRALELAPDFSAARGNLATVLYKQHRFAEAVAELDEVLSKDASSPSQRNLMAAALGRIGDYQEALQLYEELTATFGDHAKLWMSYAHILKTVGRLDDSIAAYRHALSIEPNLGEVWWSLANLKTVHFSDEDVAQMERALGSGPDLAHEDRLHLHFALGKAYADRGEAEPSFRNFDAGNQLRSAELDYDPQSISDHVDGMIAAFTPELLSRCAGMGDPSPDPIFILGLPRAGSTLLEQILSSHSQIEGTMELPDIPAMAMREALSAGGTVRDWPVALERMKPDRLAELGAEFLERTRIQRKTDRPFYIDKLPNNWLYAGFIRLILPNAKIIDARRHPMDCCFSNFRQHFAKGQGFSYNLEHIGRYYADYVRAMDHYDRVMPGQIHRVIHEQLLDDPDAIVRDLLAALGLPFEDACLDFHTNRRAVRTASSEQVRRPINRDGVDQWRSYEEWLGPLKSALGDLPETYGRRK